MKNIIHLRRVKLILNDFNLSHSHIVDALSFDVPLTGVANHAKGLWTAQKDIAIYGSQYLKNVPFEERQCKLTDIEEAACSYYDVVDVLFKNNEIRLFNELDLEGAGEYLIRLKRKEQNVEPLIFGMMNCRNEADILQRVLDSYAKDFDGIYAIDNSDDGSEDIMSNHPIIKKWWKEASVPWSKDDSNRQFLMDEIRKDHPDKDYWIFSTQADEIYYNSVRTYVKTATTHNCTSIGTQVATFILSPNEECCDNIDNLRHYIWDIPEFSGFYHKPWNHYTKGEHMRVHPRFLWPNRYFKYRLIRKHYPFRNKAQALYRVHDRVLRGWQPHYKNYKDVIYSKEVNGRTINDYNGWLEREDTLLGGNHVQG